MTTAIQKLHSEHTVADILRLKPKWFYDKQGTDAERKLAEENLTYLHALLEYGLGHMASVPFEALFPDFYFAHKPEERNHINEALMTYRFVTKRTKPVLESVLVPVDTRFGFIPSNDLKTALKPNLSAIRNRISNLNSEKRDTEINIREWQDSINSYRQYIADALQASRAMDDQLRTLQLQIESEGKNIDPAKYALLKSVPKEWVVVHTTVTDFYIVRREPIILNYIGTAESGMAKSLNMGFFCMAFDYELNCKMGQAFADYIYAGSSTKIHPHLAGSNICWGNKAHKAEALKASGDYHGYWALLESILTTYCPENPFIKFDSFESNQSTGYRYFNDELRNAAWLNGKKDRIMRMISERASDQFVDKYESTRNYTDHAEKKQERYYTYFNGFEMKLRNVGRRITDALTKHRAEAGEYMHGEEFRLELKKHIGYMPDQYFMLEKDISAYSYLNYKFLYILFAIYGFIPYRKKNANGVYTYHKIVPSYVKWRLIYIDGSVWKWELWIEEQTKTTTTSTADIRSRLMTPEEIACLPEKYRPSVVPSAVPSAVTIDLSDTIEITHDGVFADEYVEGSDDDDDYDDDEESSDEHCDHDWSRSNGVCRDCGYACDHEDSDGDWNYDSEGHCRTCGHYDSDHDENYGNEDD